MEFNVPVNTSFTTSASVIPPADLIVPSQSVWLIDNIYVKLVACATVGNRVLRFQVKNASDVVQASVEVGAVAAASETRYYLLGPLMPDLAAFRGANSDLLMTPLPELELRPGWKVCLDDSAAVDSEDTGDGVFDSFTAMYNIRSRGVLS